MRCSWPGRSYSSGYVRPAAESARPNKSWSSGAVRTAVVDRGQRVGDVGRAARRIQFSGTPSRLHAHLGGRHRGLSRSAPAHLVTGGRAADRLRGGESVERPDAGAAGTRAGVLAIIALRLAPISWGPGAILQNHKPVELCITASSAYQHLFGGLGFLLLVLLTREPLPDPSPQAWWAGATWWCSAL